MAANDKLRLACDQLYRHCHDDRFDFKSTAELAPKHTIYGQDRGVAAIEFGIDIDMPGYNIFVLGPAGSGRLTAVQQFINDRVADYPTPDDWCYVYNFKTPHCPLAIRLPEGQGSQLHAEMQTLVGTLRTELATVFESEAYVQARSQINAQHERENQALLEPVRALAAEKSFALQATPQGALMILPLDGDKPLTPDLYQALPEDERQVIDAKRREVEDAVQNVFRSSRHLQTKAQAALLELRRDTAVQVIDHYMGNILPHYETNGSAKDYLLDFREDILQSLDEFVADPDRSPTAVDGRSGSGAAGFSDTRYKVNILVEHTAEGAPVVLLDLPTYQNLIGRVEHEARMGVLTTDFTHIRAGALHEANGGFLIIRAADLLQQPFAWEALKRALNSGQVTVEDPDTRGASVMMTQRLEPGPIPLDIKVILVGSAQLYYGLHNHDESFPDLFRVKADFVDVMERTPQNEFHYADFIATRCQDEGLPHFHVAAVRRMIDYGSWLVSDQNKLTTRFGQLSRLVYESAYFAQRNQRDMVEREDVEQALAAQTYRRNQREELNQEYITEGKIFIDVTGEVVGQINGLVVIDLGDHVFGLPSRLTARVFMGRDAVVQIDRESDLTGPIHDKGLLTLQGYLGGRYAQDYPLTITASLTFEQNYGGVEGDSASSAELYALLSALSGFPIRQELAVTGSVNQRGQVQPIGGVTQKVEGFYAACKAQGLSGTQGAIIPKSNVRNLMLSDEVVKAVDDKQFHVYAIENVDEGIELLTGKTAQEVHAAVDERLRYFAETLVEFEEGGRDLE